MIEVVDKSDNKRRKILSAGKNKFGVLGLGCEVKESKDFVKVNFGIEQIIDIAISGKHAIAISKEGTIFGWGSNDNGAIGQPKDKEADSLMVPTVIPFF